MSSSDDMSRAAARSGSTDAGRGKKAGGEHPATREQEMGAALRSVYQRAVDERVPDDLMDLLGKLG